MLDTSYAVARVCASLRAPRKVISSMSDPFESDLDIPVERNARARLLREGMRLFLRDGFASVSTRQICEAAGVTQPSLYHHFGSKEGLYFAVITQWFADLRIAMTDAITHGDTFRDRLLNLAVFFWSGRAGEYQAMQHDAMQHMPRERIPELRLTILESVVNPLLDLMRSGIASGVLPAQADPYVLMELYWALIDGFTGIYHRGDPLPPPESNTAPIDLFLAGAYAIPATTYSAWPQLPPLEALKRDANQAHER